MKSYAQDHVHQHNPPRDRHLPIKLQYYVAHIVRYPLTKSLTYQRLSPSHTAFLTAITNIHEPKNFQEAQNQVVWKKAMLEELTAL